MNAHFNQLSPAETERLVMLGEEAAETVQALAIGDDQDAVRIEMMDFHTIAKMVEEDCGAFPQIAVEVEGDAAKALIAQAGRVIQITSKILRHGYESFHPADPDSTNRYLLRLEVARMLYLMERNGHRADPAMMRATLAKKLRFTHHQKKIGYR